MLTPILTLCDCFFAQGELAPTAVNAPMVSAEVLAELQPFVLLAQGLGRAAVQLVGDNGFSELAITYTSPRQVFTNQHSQRSA